MTQGAGQGPVVRTPTVRDFRVPAYVHEAGPVHPDRPDPRPDPRVGPHPGSAGPHPGTTADPGAAPARPPQPTTPPDGAPYRPASAPAHPEPGPHRAPGEHPAPGDRHAPVAAHPAAPGGTPPYDGGEEPEGYTPTQRDLPVIKRGDTLPAPEGSPAPAPAPPAPDGPGPLYVVGDVHGYLDELVAALHEQGLIDTEGNWSAGTTRLWFLGDFTDRGPDGIGVIDLVMKLSAEAAAAGGYCKALMGNHELLLIGARRFGDTPVNSGAGTATFQAAWLLNGGQKADMDRLQDHHLQWMSRLDAMVEEDGHLLLHSDTTAYLDYGDSIEAVNDTVRETLTRNDADECWDLFRKFTKRFAFRDEAGPQAARELLSAYGGSRVVHGHSPIPYLLGEVGSEDDDDSRGPVVHGPHVYADGLAIAMDGGVTMAGKLLVQQLPLHD
ncbi:metallophosphoesterase [Streptomyces sp. NPDC005955]|uniref:metallophosphoesterase n=1 Tax=Streptomyces sp. NPDC005955 TaxID=3364738 RepID=UPI0036CE4323